MHSKQNNILENSLLDFVLFAPNEPDDVNIVLSNEEKDIKVVIILNETLDENLKSLLIQILKAVNIDFEKETKTYNSTINSNFYIKDLNAKKYMLMGVNPDFLNLNINLPKYHIFNVHKQIIIKTDPISEINNNQMLKKQLWDAIKVWKV